MALTTEPFEAQSSGRLLTPADLPEVMPSLPTQTICPQGPDGVVVQRFATPPSSVSGTLKTNLLVLYLGEPALIEERSSGLPFERRWAERQQITLVPAGQPIHRVFRNTTNAAFIHLQSDLVRALAAEIYGEDLEGLTLTPRLAVSDDTAARLATVLLNEIERPGCATELMSDALCRALVTHLLRHYSNHAPPQADPRSFLVGWRLRRAEDFMRDHLAEAITVAELAGECGLSGSHFTRAFRIATGRSPHQYFIRLRLEQARELLEHSEVSIIQVGLLCGFEQPAHFAFSFRKAFGLSPRAWRIERRS